MYSALSLISLLTACGPKTPPQAPTAMVRQFSELPQPLAPRAFQLPEVERGELDNGIPVLLSQNSEVPLIFVKVVFEPGGWSETKQHVAKAAMTLIDNGSGDYNADAFAQKQRELAASVYASSKLDYSVAGVNTLKKNMDDSIGLLATMLQAPAFPNEDWEVEQQQLIQNIQSAQQQPSAICANVFNRLLYGDQYLGTIESPEAMAQISTKDIRRWHKQNIVPANAKIAVAGATTLEEIIPVLNQHFGQWDTKGAVLPDKPQSTTLPKAESTKVYLVDKPGAAQSVVRFGQFTLAESHDDYLALELANETIGGMFIARVNMNLREDKGWTYGARSWHYPSFVTSRWALSSNIVTEHTVAAVAEVRKELRQAQEDQPITSDELTAAKGNILGSFPQQFERPDSILNEIIRLETYDLPTDSLKSYPDDIRNLDLAQAQTAWNNYIDIDQLLIVIVGDAEKIESGLLEQGLPVIRVDETGQKIE